MSRFQEELAERVNARFARHVDAERAEIYTFVREVALESFKNGLASAKRKSTAGNGSALQNGRLRPVSSA